MSRFNFKGALEYVKDCQIEFISEVLKKKGFKGSDVLIENVGEAGDGFIANVKRVVVKENGETFKMIAKIGPDSPTLRFLIGIDTMFANEHVIYRELLPKFTEVQKNGGVVEEELFKYAVCYGSYKEKPNEIILLEDLKESKFNILDRFKPLNNNCVNLALKNFAIYHSLSFVLKHQEPEMFEAIKLKLGDLFKIMSENQDNRDYYIQIEERALKALDDDKYRNVVENTVQHMLTLANGIKIQYFDSPYLVIQHGDGWTNNLLFKLKDDVPVECIMIDYQMVKANSPVYDLMYFLFNSTSHEQRLQHYYEFIDYYYNELDNSLQIYGLKASSVYPREQLDKDLKNHGKLILAVCIHAASFIRSSDSAAKVKKLTDSMKIDDSPTDIVNSMFDTDSDTQLLFKSKIEGLVDSLLEFQLIE